MKDYQQNYIDNLTEIAGLISLPGHLPENAYAFWKDQQEKAERIRRLTDENTRLLKEHLMPLLDDIISAPREEVNELEEFAEKLLAGNRQLDLFLNYMIRNALVTYARKWNLRDMLIRELYYVGLALFYMQDQLLEARLHFYRWKESMMFGEAASYIKRYDEISDAATRGFIHRSMANLALSYPWTPEDNAVRKMDAIRYSLNILSDPVYHEKTPSLPWDVFLYKSHQERMAGVSYLRYARGQSKPQIVKEVLESAEYVWEKLREDSRRSGRKISLGWTLRYEAVQYHCGIRPLSWLLSRLEQKFMERDGNDYTLEGIEGNIYLPAIYAEYLSYDKDMRYKKRDILGYMYRMLVKYVRNMPGNQLDAKLIRNLMLTMNSFVEYPGGITLKDFLLELVVCRNPDMYASFTLIAHIAREMLEKTLEREPERLLGVLSCSTTKELLERRGELLRFVQEAGMLHNVGFLSVSSLVSRSGRSWFGEEQKMFESRVYAARNILSRCDSTKAYADIAFGYTRYYDEKGGYPEEYTRAGKTLQPVTDLISAASFLIHCMDTPSIHGRGLGLDQALEEVRAGAGTRLSPFFVGLLSDMKEELREYLKDARIRAYEDAFCLLQGPADTKIPLSRKNT